MREGIPLPSFALESARAQYWFNLTLSIQRTRRRPKLDSVLQANSCQWHWCSSYREKRSQERAREWVSDINSSYKETKFADNIGLATWVKNENCEKRRQGEVFEYRFDISSSRQSRRNRLVGLRCLFQLYKHWTASQLGRHCGWISNGVIFTERNMSTFFVNSYLVTNAKSISGPKIGCALLILLSFLALRLHSSSFNGMEC